MLHEERVTYETLRTWALECYYEGCRDHALPKGWPHEQIMGYVAYQFENALERPVEKFMWSVILLILSGGWHREWHARAYAQVAKHISENGLSNLLENIPAPEYEAVVRDLAALGLVERAALGRASAPGR